MSKTIYKEIREKYKYCVICGSSERLEVHHLRFRSQGGSNEPDNLVLLCSICHQRRHNEEILIELEGNQIKVTDKSTGEITWHSTKPHVPTEEEGLLAYRVHEHIVSFKKDTELAFWNLGNCLRLMRDESYYKILGHETFNEYLGSPEVSIQRAQAYKLIGVVEQCDRLGLEPERVQQLDKDKLAVALPKASTETIEDILSDCEVLSRSDIREAYGSGSSNSEKQDSICEQEFACSFCGKTNRVRISK